MNLSPLKAFLDKNKEQSKPKKKTMTVTKYFRWFANFAYIHRKICNIPLMITNTIIYSDREP